MVVVDITTTIVVVMIWRGGGYINTQVLVKYHLSIDIYIGIYTMILTNYMLVLQAYSSLGDYEFHHILITYALLLLEY